MTYLCLDMFGHDWHFTRANKRFQAVFALWIAIPALLTPFWAAPALLKAITAMVGNLLLAPLAVAVIFYFVNRPSMGQLKANAARNAVLAVTLLFALGLAAAGVVRSLS
jgi:Mn2+/Fe2+ NRAMP family transporter